MIVFYRTLEGYTEKQEETGKKILLIKDAGTRQERIPALHGMKYFQILLINYIIHYFWRLVLADQGFEK